MKAANKVLKYKKLFALFVCFGFLLSTPFVGKSNAAVATVDFLFTGAQQTWTVPETGSYTIEAWGAQGGNAGYNGTISTYGGKGGYASGSISLTANQIIYIYVGGQGQGGTGTANNNQFLGGYNGGGYGYNGTGSGQRGAGGGGGTDLRVVGTALSDRVLVAGGGAGGVYYPGYGVNNPGAGGGAIGVTGSSTSLASTSFHGKGGTQVGGGAGGSNGSVGGTGSAGNGGNAVFYGFGESGAGAGYFGGGASGAGTAAGGGSGYVGGVTSSTNTAGNASMPNPVGGAMTGRDGNGFLRITYTVNDTSAFNSLALAGSAVTATYRSAVVITANVTVAARVTFIVNGKAIPGCKNKLATGSSSSFSATCSWKPSFRGAVSLTATATPTGAGVTGATATPVRIMVAGRTGTRVA